VVHFTVGQRKGLGLSGNDEPLFVVRLDAKNARVVVAPREALRMRTIILRDVNWLAPHGGAVECAVKVRSLRPPVMALVTPLPNNAAQVELLAAEEGVAPGQACVFYEPNGSRVLGGGWISAAEPTRAAA
jgi:tRNA-specific 2-thiouridylase